MTRPGLTPQANDSLNQILADDAGRMAGKLVDVDVAAKDMNKINAATRGFLEPSPRPVPKRVRRPVDAVMAVSRLAGVLKDLTEEDRAAVMSRLTGARLSETAGSALSYCERNLAELDDADRAKVLGFLGASEALK